MRPENRGTSAHNWVKSDDRQGEGGTLTVIVWNYSPMYKIVKPLNINLLLENLSYPQTNIYGKRTISLW